LSIIPIRDIETFQITSIRFLYILYTLEFARFFKYKPGQPYTKQTDRFFISMLCEKIRTDLSLKTHIFEIKDSNYFYYCTFLLWSNCRFIARANVRNWIQFLGKDELFINNNYYASYIY